MSTALEDHDRQAFTGSQGPFDVRVDHRAGGVSVTDLGALAGISSRLRFNGSPIVERWVSSGDHFNIGDLLLVFGEHDRPSLAQVG